MAIMQSGRESPSKHGDGASRIHTPLLVPHSRWLRYLVPSVSLSIRHCHYVLALIHQTASATQMLSGAFFLAQPLSRACQSVAHHRQELTRGVRPRIVSLTMS